VGGRVFELVSSPHRAAEALMPWLLNGTLRPAERRRLEAHLRDCAVCRAELERQRSLFALYSTAASSEPAADGRAAFAHLSARLDAEAAAPARAPKPAWGWPLLAGLQFCAIAALAWAVWAVRPESVPGASQVAAYRGLGSSSAAADGDAIVLFVPDAPESELRHALQRAGARIVDGPTAAGAYVLRFDRGASDAVLDALRGERYVMRVERLTAAEGTSTARPAGRD
jgi:hypothetical protein